MEEHWSCLGWDSNPQPLCFYLLSLYKQISLFLTIIYILIFSFPTQIKNLRLQGYVVVGSDVNYQMEYLKKLRGIVR